MAKLDRLCGILLHVTSLPSPGGIGDMGPAAYQFVDFLHSSKQRLWQVLPLSPVGYGNSPYAALSAFAGSPLLISLELLADKGYIAHDRLHDLAPAHGPVDFSAAYDHKLPLIEEAARNFLNSPHGDDWQRFEQFCTSNSEWLNDYAMYAVLRRMHDYACWCDWPHELAFRDPDALTKFQQEYGDKLAVQQAMQFFFTEQWNALRDYCKQRDVRVMGDIAIFVNYDSADVWTHRLDFDLDEAGQPRRVSGVPPDYFSATGQKWGNPLYRWEKMESEGFPWWIDRIRRALALYDLIRLDHFRGFAAYWSVPAEEDTAINGEWVKAPGEALFWAMLREFGQLPFVAEDLGVITPDVDALRESFGMPGMRVLQFGFGGRGAHIHLPHKFTENTVTYTGTHDNNTTLGWWLDNTTEHDRQQIQTYLGPVEFDGRIVWKMMRSAAASVAKICIFPMQDVLHLGSEARMNTPAAGEGNWSWRYWPGALHYDLTTQLADLMEVTDRDGYVEPVTEEEIGEPIPPHDQPSS